MRSKILREFLLDELGEVGNLKSIFLGGNDGGNNERLFFRSIDAKHDCVHDQT